MTAVDLTLPRRRSFLSKYLLWAKGLGIGLLVPITLLILWQITSFAGWISLQILPAPIDVVRTGLDLWRSGDLALHGAISLQRIFYGFAIGAALGLILGIGIGIGEAPKLIIIAKAALLPIALKSLEGYGRGCVAKFCLAAYLSSAGLNAALLFRCFISISSKGSQFPKSVILYAVFFYVRYGVSYRDLQEIMAERGVSRRSCHTQSLRDKICAQNSCAGPDQKAPEC